MLVKIYTNHICAIYYKTIEFYRIYQKMGVTLHYRPQIKFSRDVHIHLKTYTIHPISKEDLEWLRHFSMLIPRCMVLDVITKLFQQICVYVYIVLSIIGPILE